MMEQRGLYKKPPSEHAELQSTFPGKFFNSMLARWDFPPARPVLPGTMVRELII